MVDIFRCYFITITIIVGGITMMMMIIAAATHTIDPAR